MQKNTARKNTVFTVGCSLVLLSALAMGFGCAPKSRGLSDATAEGYGASSTRADGQGDLSVDRRVRDYLAAEKNDPRAQEVLIQTAKTALGTPYVRGGTSTDGFDCSGFVQWTFNQMGVKLPRTAREQSRVGQAIRNVDDVQVGDIVAFHHPKRGYHTGIYVGEGKFIHSPRKRTSVRIASMDDPYFSKNFLSARRIGVSSPEDIEAAESMLAEYRAQEVRRSRTKDGKGSKQVARADNKRSKKAHVSSSRSRNKSKDVDGVRNSSSRKIVSKESRQREQSTSKERSFASKNTEVKKNRSTEERARSSTGTSAGRSSAAKSSADKQKTQSAARSAPAGQKSSNKKTAEKSSPAQQNRGTQKKGS